VPKFDWSKTYNQNEEMAYGPFQPITTLTASWGVATAITINPHGYVTGMDVLIRGATQTAFNGRVNVTVVDDTTFTYKVPDATPATTTGTLTCSNMVQYWKAALATATVAGDTPDSAPTKWTRIYGILPNADDGVYINNRLVVITAYTPGATTYDATSVYTKSDFLASSDVQDEIHVDWYEAFRINQGSSDELLDLKKFGDDTLVCLKGKSWGVLSGLSGDWSANARLDMRDKEYGLSANGASVVAGANVYFLSDKRGVVSLRQTEQGKVQSVDLPLSDEIQPLIDKIDWTRVSEARMAYWDNKLYVAVPMADKPTILVYDFLTEKWTPRDTGSALKVLEFFKTKFNGVERLFFVSQDGYVNLMEESFGGDEVGTAASVTGLDWEQIVQRWRTRMYATPNNRAGKPMDMGLVMATWDPRYTVAAIYDGQNEVQQVDGDGVTEFTKNRVKYDRPFDAEDYDPTNVNDDFGKPYRQDYSVTLTSDGLYLGSGVQLDAMQDSVHPLSLAPQEGRGVQIEVINLKGRMVLKAVDVGGVWRKQRKGVFI
jgi:hypothetical protein